MSRGAVGAGGISAAAAAAASARMTPSDEYLPEATRRTRLTSPGASTANSRPGSGVETAGIEPASAIA